MNDKPNYKTEFTFILITSLILIFIFDKPTRNNIPVFFGIVGFGRFAYLTWKKFYKLSDTLVKKHKKMLDENGVQFKSFGGLNTVDFFDLLGQRKKMIKKEQPLKNDLTEFITLLNVTMISFLCFVLLGIITVLIA